MTFDLGLTGSIGMACTTAALFADRGCAVWDADAAVHSLYQPGGAGADAIRGLCSNAVTHVGVDRQILKLAIADDPTLLKRVEAVIHPLVATHRENFRKTATSEVRVFDIPLLFEKGSEGEFDAVACVNVPQDVQWARVLARENMTEATLDMILSKQMPNADKVARADYVIDTSTLETASADVDRIMADIAERSNHA